jgi:predicted dehydrogenase
VAWRSKESVGGGCVMGSGVHNLDLMRWFFGEPLEVFAYGVKDPQRLEAEVAASISFRFKNGLVVNFACNWAAHGALKDFRWGEWAVFGARGDIAIHEDVLLVGHEFGRSVERISPDPGQYESLWTHFASCITHGTEPLTSGPEGRASLALVLKVYEAMEQGRPVGC